MDSDVQHVLFEDAAVGQLAPLTALRPCGALRIGARALYEVQCAALGEAKPAVAVRPTVAPLLARWGWRDFERAGGGKPWCCIHAAWLPEAESLEAIRGLRPGEGLRWPNGQALAFVTGERDLVHAIIRQGCAAAGERIRWRPVAADCWLSHPARLIDQLERGLRGDLEQQVQAGRGPGAATLVPVAPRDGVYVSRGPVYAAPDVHFTPPVTLDARGGPIVLGAQVEVKPGTTLEGPLAVDAGAILLGGRIARSYIGPGTRVHGEVSDCIFQGWSNKSHAGFLGHSYCGEWVNLGASTTGSNLKNNYGEIRCWDGRAWIATGRQKLGSIVGDQTRTAIGTLLPSGSVIGVSVNLFGAAEMAPKWVPSFVWGVGETAVEYELERCLVTVERVLARRDQRLDDGYRRALLAEYLLSAEPRAAYLGASGAGAHGGE